MAISRPRTGTRSRSVSAARFNRRLPELRESFLCASHASPVVRAPGGSSPSSTSDNIVFPQPDSPTRPREKRCCRSEEHTSELQSRLHLVCRLLLEKKKHA